MRHSGSRDDGVVYAYTMTRTNVVVDDRLIERVMRTYRLRTKREAIDLALRSLVGEVGGGSFMELEGSGWAGDLARMRDDRPADAET